MKNRKLLVMLGITTLALSAFVGCSSSETAETEETTIESIEVATDTEEEATEEETSEEVTEEALVDGTYVVAYDTADENGFKSFLEVTVADGLITEVNFDETNDNNETNKEDDEKDTALEDALLTATSPEAFEEMVKDMEEGESFKTLVSNLVEQMKVGNTEAIVVSSSQN